MKRSNDMKVKSLLIVLFYCIVIQVTAQTNQKYLNQGNKAFAEQKFAEAEANYRIEKSKSGSQNSASYNLGNSIYKQKSYSESKQAYLSVIENSTDKSEKHKAYHNIGNVYMKEKNYQGAVEAYKNALRNNPSDNQTRYNYALAKELLDKNPPPQDQNQDNQGKSDNEQKDQNKQNQKGGEDQNSKNEQKDQEQNQNEKNSDQGEHKDNQDKKSDGGNQDQKPKGDDPGMPKQRMKNLLDAVENQEKGIQKKVQTKRELENKKGESHRPEKNW